MLKPGRSIFEIGILTILMFIGGLLAHAAPDDLATSIRLSGIPGPYSFAEVCKTRSGDLWIVGGGGSVAKISPDGATKKMRVSDLDLNGVFFVNANFGWVVGNQGIIMHTADGGRHWKRQTSGTDEKLHAITCTSENRCWAVGNNATILETRNGGQGWQKLQSGLTADLFAVEFVNDATGWAVGENGSIAHTVDGGQSWEKQHASLILFPSGPFAKLTDFVALRFVDEKRGWVAGSGGVCRTVDGGKTWEVKQIEYSSFIGLVSNDGKTVCAVSSDGRNYLTKDGGSTWVIAGFTATAGQQSLNLEPPKYRVADRDRTETKTPISGVHISVDPASDCRTLNPKQPPQFISFTGRFYKAWDGEHYVRGVVLRLTNNSNCGVLVETPPGTAPRFIWNGKYVRQNDWDTPELRDGSSVAVAYHIYSAGLNRPKKPEYSGDVILKSRINPGHSVLFSVPLKFVKQGARIELPFNYDPKQETRSVHFIPWPLPKAFAK
jgi:photosystem II stability/assembly factor-like uncharacterized protein